MNGGAFREIKTSREDTVRILQAMVFAQKIAGRGGSLRITLTLKALANVSPGFALKLWDHKMQKEICFATLTGVAFA